eukprot:1157375-Pelagomonas_calceolata.AAC.15
MVHLGLTPAFLAHAGVKQCINRALQSSGISPEQVDYVNAHATSTQAGDMVGVGAGNSFPAFPMRLMLPTHLGGLVERLCNVFLVGIKKGMHA